MNANLQTESSYDKYISIVDDYISGEFNGLALSIYGEWGTGKTFFIKNILDKHLQNKNLDQSLIYVSLNGLSKPSDIYYRLLSNYLSDSKWMVSSQWILKALGRFGAEKLKLIDEADIEKMQKKAIGMATENMENNILCFDDFERIDEKEISYKALLGFISNQFLEKNIKTIFISHDKKIGEQSYNLIKEKYIYKDINFSPSISEIYDNIIAAYNKDKTYFEFLLLQKDVIISLVNESEHHNIRTLRYFMDSFQQIHKYFQEGIDISTKLSILQFTFICSYEYKLGNLISFRESETILPKSSLEIMFLKKNNPSSNEIENEIELKKLKISERYMNHTDLNYQYYGTVLKYIVDGYLNKQQLLSEIEYNNPSSISKQQLIYQKLENFDSLSDEDFQTTVKDFIIFLKDGAYDILSLPSKANTLSFFKNMKLIDHNIQGLIDEAIAVSMKKYIHNPLEFEHFYHSPSTTYSSEFTNSVRDSIISQINQKLDEEKKDEILDMYKDLFEEDNLNKVYLREFHLLFSSISTKELIKYIRSASNEGIRLFSMLLESHFNNYDYKSYIEQEKSSLLELLEDLKSYSDELGDATITKYTVNLICKNIQSNLPDLV